MNSLAVFKAGPHVQIPKNVLEYIKSKRKIQVNLLSDNTSVIDLGSPYVGLKFPNILRPTKPVASRLTEAERLPQLPFFNFSRCCAASEDWTRRQTEVCRTWPVYCRVFLRLLCGALRRPPSLNGLR